MCGPGLKLGLLSAALSSTRVAVLLVEESELFFLFLRRGTVLGDVDDSSPLRVLGARRFPEGCPSLGRFPVVSNPFRVCERSAILLVLSAACLLSFLARLRAVRAAFFGLCCLFHLVKLCRLSRLRSANPTTILLIFHEVPFPAPLILSMSFSAASLFGIRT